MASIFYLDYELGNDSTTDTPLGWWSVAFTGGTGTEPAADTTVTGGTSGSTAKTTVVVISSGTFAGNDAAGTMYFYGKSAAFQSEEVSWSTGHIDIGGDFTYCAWKTISTTGAKASRIAPGDTIRVAKSPAPVSLGVNGKWTDNTIVGGGFPATLAVTGTADASGLIRLTLANTATLANNDVVQILSVGGTIEANGVWLCTVIDATHIDLQGTVYANAWTSGGTIQKINSKAVVLTLPATPFTYNITSCDTASGWVGANDGTPSLITFATDAKEGHGCIKILMDASTQTNKIQSYLPISIPAATAGNYQKITFWIKNSAAIADATTWSITLCSNADGTGVLDTFPIPAIASVNRWIPLTITRSGGLNLGNNGATAIASIAINSGATAPTNNSYIYIDNIMMCQDTTTGKGLSLQSLISLNTTEQGGTEAWYAIQSINTLGNIILLDNDTNNKSNLGRGYSGSGGTATTYIRETIKTTLQTVALNAAQEVQESGTVSSPTAYEGGYDTSTNGQTGDTFLDGLNGFGVGITISGKSYNTFNYFAFTRYNEGYYFISGSTYCTINNLTNANNCTSYGINIQSSYFNTINNIININNCLIDGIMIYSGSGNIIDNVTNCNNNLGPGIVFSTDSCSNYYGTITNANNNASYGIFFGGTSNYNTINLLSNASYNANSGVYFENNTGNIVVTVSSAAYNTSYGVKFSSLANYNYVYNLSTTGNGTAGVFNQNSINFLRNAVIAEGTPFAGAATYTNSRLYIERYGGTENNHYIYTDSGTIVSDSSVNRHTASGICWKFNVTHSRREIKNPLRMVIARIAVGANFPVTVKAYFKVTNTTDIAGRLILRGGQLAGDANTVNGIYQATTNANTDYEELSITFTPTEAGVVEIEAQAYWLANTADESVYVDDITINGGGYSPSFRGMDIAFQAQPFVINQPTGIGVIIG